MRIQDSVALVTGASRGLGQVFAQGLADRGARTVYAAARDPATVAVTGPNVVPVALDVTDAGRVAQVARECPDVSLLINNAGIMERSPLLEAPAMDAARLEMETNYFGTLAMCRAFAPVLAANGGGAVVNMLSVVSWFTNPVNGSYCASKAAAWAMTNGVRIELAPQGTLVVAVHAGFVDTEMAARIAGPDDRKISPADVARQVFDAVEAGQIEVLADARTRRVKDSVPRDHELIYPRLQAAWTAGHPAAADPGYAGA
ncbi:MAG TPA: SDR family oxidoreductase [Streptosporangiaceae bacterium]